MKILEGKSPSERKKIIAALALGVVTVCALFYTFVLSSASSKPVRNSNANAANSNSAATRPEKAELLVEEFIPTPIPENPFPPLGDGGVSRNIFAFYEAPAPTPPPPPGMAPITPTPTPTPTPPPPVLITSVVPSTAYAGTAGFQMEVVGDKFTPELKILFNGAELPTQFNNPQRLTTQISAQQIAGEGERQITVRTPDGKLFSNPLIFNVQQPPQPNFNFVGLVARKRYDNDTALLQNKQNKEYISVRLNDTVPDRFRVVSISSSEVWVMDTALKLRHKLPFIVEQEASKAGVVPGREGVTRGNRNNFPSGFDQTQQYQSIPGIPDNIPRYVPPQPQQQPQIQPAPNPDSKQPSRENIQQQDDDPNL